MRILNLCVETDKIMGGRGEMNAQVMPRLQAMGHTITWVSLRDDWVDRPTFETVKPNSPWPFISATDSGVALQSMHSIVMHCLQMGNRFDIILAHDWDMQFVAEELSKIWCIPWAACFHLFQYEMALLEGKQSTDEDLLPISMELGGLMNATRVTCVSFAMKKFAEDAMQISRQVDVVHNGVTVTDTPYEPEQRSGKPKLLYIGRIAPQKGFDAILDLAERTDAFDITFCGKHAALPDVDTENTLDMQRIRRLEKLPHFHYAGWVGRDERSKFYEACDFVVMPSRGEPFGIVGLEAMAHRRPLITTQVQGIGEYADDTNSLKIEATADSIAEAVTQFHSRHHFLREIVKAGYQTASAFSWEAVAEKYDQLIRSVIDGYFKVDRSGNECGENRAGGHSSYATVGLEPV